MRGDGVNPDGQNDRLFSLESSQGRLASDVLRLAEKLQRIEVILLGPNADEEGGLRRHMRIIEDKIKEVTIWVKALIAVAVFWIVLFGPQRLQEIVKLFK
jgi:hypothetical protein